MPPWLLIFKRPHLRVRLSDPVQDAIAPGECDRQRARVQTCVEVLYSARAWDAFGLAANGFSVAEHAFTRRARFACGPSFLAFISWFSFSRATTYTLGGLFFLVRLRNFFAHNGHLLSRFDHARIHGKQKSWWQQSSCPHSGHSASKQMAHSGDFSASASARFIPSSRSCASNISVEKHPRT